MKISIYDLPEIQKNKVYHEHEYFKYAVLDVLGYEFGGFGMMGCKHDFQVFYKDCVTIEGGKHVKHCHKPNPFTMVADIIELFQCDIEKTVDGWVVRFMKNPWSRYNDDFVYHTDFKTAVLLAVLKCNVGEYIEIPYGLTKLFDRRFNLCKCAICKVIDKSN